MNRLIFVLFLVLSLPAYAESIEVDIRCFSSSDEAIQLEFRTYADEQIGWVGGQIRYKQSQEFIPLVFHKQEIIDQIPDRPWAYRYTWLEIVNGAVNGRYELLAQGANIYSFAYISNASGESFDISREIWPDEDGNCTW